MLTMAVGQSDDVDPAVAVREAIAQCRAQLGDRTPVAGLLFASFDTFDPVIAEAVRAEFPGILLIGATSAAQMSSVAGYLEDSIALTLFAVEDIDITVGLGEHIEVDAAAAARSAVDQALGQTTREPRLCILLADPLNGQRAMEAVRAILPPGVAVVGGASSGPNLGLPRPSYQLLNNRVVEDAVVILVFSGAIAYSLSVGTGLRLIGRTGTVTRSEYGQIMEIDGRPATAFTSGYLDVGGPATFGNPLAVRETDGSDWYVRVMLTQDPETGAIAVPGQIPVGSVVQLTTASSDEIVAATGDTVRRARASFPDGATPTGALIFSCAVRKFLLGTRTGQELAEARALLAPDLPVAGMYCTGEIAPVGGESPHFLNESFVALLLGG